MRYNKRAQAFIEYAFLIGVISAALVAMLTYMNHSMNARLKQVQVEMNERVRGKEVFVGVEGSPRGRVPIEVEERQRNN